MQRYKAKSGGHNGNGKLSHRPNTHMVRPGGGDPFYEKGLPQNVEAERSILGAVLLDNAVIDQAIDLLRRDDFFLDSNRRIFDKMCRLSQRNFPIDIITLSDELRRDAEFEQVGGHTYIASLIDGVPRTDTIEPYAIIVKQKARARRLITASNQIIARAFDDPDDPALAVDAEQLIADAAHAHTPSSFVHISDPGRRYIGLIEQASASGDRLTGLATGFIDFDLLTLGLQKKDLIILAGRPSEGKTTCVSNIADHVSLAGYKAGIFELEMTDERIYEKLLSRHARINSHKMRSGKLNTDEWHRITAAHATISESGLYICDKPGLSPIEMRASARRLMRDAGGLDLLIVDYLQLMEGRKGKEGRYEIVTDNAQQLKNLAKELDMPVIALSQLNRASEHRGKGKGANHRAAAPQLSDLRESGNIEQVADVVAFIWRPYPNDKEDLTACITVGKNRNGPTGEFNLTYIRAENRFEEQVKATC